MNLFKRSIISIRRCLGRSFVLFGAVFLLATVMSAALSVRQAIINTDMALRASLPAVATVVIDGEARQQHFDMTGEWLTGHPTPTIIEEIGHLPYVRDFNYSAWGYSYFSAELVRAFDESLYESLYAYFDIPESGRNDTGSLSYFHDTPLEQFTLKGVHNPDILDINAGLINLVAGRVFTAEDIENVSPVAVVSQDFLNANNLALGSFFTLDYHIYDEVAGAQFYTPEFDDSLLFSQSFVLEVVGVFEKDMEIRNTGDIRPYFDFVNRIYVTNGLVLSVLDLYLEALPYIDPELYEVIAKVGNIEEFISYDEILFLLYDPTELAAFAEAANDLLPGFWIVEDLSGVYADMANSLAMMNEIANGLAVGALIASLVILSLLIIFFLVDRKAEIGIYTALGERKRNVFIQFMMEVIVPAVFGITLALFIGNMLSDHFSREIIANDLMRQLEDPERVVVFGPLFGMGFRAEMTPEEMLAMYEVVIEPMLIITFYGVALTTILLAVGIPIWMYVRRKPKSIL